MTDWKPDTCGCALRVEEDWSQAVPLVRCGYHAKHPDEEHFGVVLKENQTKNRILSHIKDNHPDAHLANKAGIAHKDENGWAAAYGILGSVTFDEERNFRVQLPTLKDQDKRALQAALDETHGAGKATVD